MATDTEVERNEVEVRQGSTRPKLIYVLVAGVSLVLVAFVIASVITH